ncbi:hypothetical protein [Paracoccus beibuensis]|uniref:hypothetical protein n=1 Tax=Paracoccus beibuensis TaxID=547602 RepID=UPI0022406DAA|nr:hypothetical protein [Paracoccus beibuensis]
MTTAKLTFEGVPPMEGTVEAGGDYVRFHTTSVPDADALAEPRDGMIDFDGHCEKVLLESAQPSKDDSNSGGYELVLRRYQPSA